MEWGGVTESDGGSTPMHRYSTFTPQEMAVWLNAVAHEYVQLRSECSVELPSALDLAGIGLFDVSQIKAKLAEKLVPSSAPSKSPFSVTRSDLSETAAYMLLERTFKTDIAYKPVRDRELIQLPGRGIDAIGIEKGEKLLVVLCEVKFSDEASSPKPPQVVDTSKDCMRLQHLGHLQELGVTSAKIWDCARRARNAELQQSLMAAALYLEKGIFEQVGIVSCCVLMRPQGHHSPGDFGSFHAKADDYKPAQVRFLVWSLPGDLTQILTEWDVAVKAAKAAA